MTQEYKTVAELFEDPKRWIKENMSTDIQGNPTNVNEAVCWCLMGAMLKIYPKYTHAWDAVINELNGKLITWNDAPERTHEEVIALCKKLGI